MYGRVRYDKDTDSFSYEIMGDDGEWGLCRRSRCVAREDAGEDEGTDYVSWRFMMRVVNDCRDYGVHLV